MSSNSSAILFKNVSKKYLIGEQYYPSLRDWVSTFFSREFFEGKKSFYALRDFNLSIAPGKSVGIIGPNGAGKSTILKLISRVIIPTSGSIETKGKIAGLLELGAGFHPELTGRENIFFQGAILGMSKAEIEKQTSDIIAFSGLGEFIDSPIKHFSSGMYARLGFSVAVHLNPDILLIDEILAVGDLAFYNKCVTFMKEFCRDPRRTVVFVTHSLSSIRDICDEVLWIENGTLYRKGDVKKITKEYEKQYGR